MTSSAGLMCGLVWVGMRPLLLAPRSLPAIPYWLIDTARRTCTPCIRPAVDRASLDTSIMSGRDQAHLSFKKESHNLITQSVKH